MANAVLPFMFHNVLMFLHYHITNRKPLCHRYSVMYDLRLFRWTKMPRHYKQVPGKRNYMAYSDDKLQTALQDIQNKTLTQRQASVYYGIPRSTLRSKIRGKHPMRPGGQTVLSADEEEMFVNYCVTTHRHFWFSLHSEILSRAPRSESSQVQEQFSRHWLVPVVHAPSSRDNCPLCK